MDIVALDHVQIGIPAGKEAEARRFYGDILGLPEVPKPAQLISSGGCWFSSNGVHVHLGIMQPFVPATKAHPAFRVADLAVAKERFAQADIDIKPDERLPHVRRFFVNDPFGNRIEFLQDGDRYL